MSAAYDITVSSDWSSTRARWAERCGQTVSSPFQTLSWLDAWYANYSRAAEPVLIEVTRGPELVALFPFVVLHRGSQRVLAFADLDVSDFNAPILGPAAPTTPTEARSLWRAVRAVLPAVDIVDLRKMPMSVAGRVNPLALLGGLAPSPMTGHLISVADWSSYHAGLERRVRMEFERSWRVFQRTASARFVRIRDAEAAHHAIDTMDRQQRARMAEVGTAFLLDRPREHSFYRYNLAERLAANEVIITALMAGEEIVAALYAFSDGQTPAVVRISNAGGDWSKVSPGRLIVHRTLEHLVSEGIHQMELSIGDYDYKRRFGPTKTPLLEHVFATSWRGQTSAVRHRAISAIRRHPVLEARLRRLFSKPDPATGLIPKRTSGIEAHMKKGEA